MRKNELIHERLTGSVIGAFFEVYNTLGYGFLEHVYVRALERELLDRGHRVGREVAVPITYKHLDLGCHRLDLIVEDLLVIETKSGPELPKIAPRQLLNYLRATELELGLLLFFGPDPEFHRIVNQYRPKRNLRKSAASAGSASFGRPRSQAGGQPSGEPNRESRAPESPPRGAGRYSGNSCPGE